MFQTEPILYLQAHGNEWLTFFMILVTSMGSSVFLIAIIIMTTFGVDFKKGFLLFELLIWTGLLTGALKILIAFPRPDFVDNRIQNLEFGTNNTSPFGGNYPEGIFQLPGQEILKAFRLQDSVMKSPFGFPSGHVALTTALWGAFGIIFNNKLIKTFFPFMVITMALSRMYLGRHFLGDVLGGALLGLSLLLVFVLFLKSSLKDDFFKKENFKPALKPKNLLFYLFLFVIPALLTGLNLVASDAAGLIFGANLAYLLILREGLPVSTENPIHKISRVLIALGIFGTSSLVLNAIFEPLVITDYLQFNFEEFLKSFIPALTLWIAVNICAKLGLYTREKG